MDSWNFQYSLDVDLENSVIYEKIYGVWRRQTAENYNIDYKRETAELIKKPWAKLCDLTNWKTGSPEVIEIIGNHLEWCRQHSLVVSVNIINNSVTYAQLQKMFQRGGTKDMSQTFRTRAEGERYLKDMGFKIRTANDERLFK